MHNTIVAAGYVAADPEIREVKGDNKVCKLRLCISSNKAKTPCFIDAELWNRQAEIAAEYLSKGRRIIINGELCNSSWEKDGKTFYKYFIRAEGFTFISNDKEEGKSDDGGGGDKKAVSNDDDEDIPF